MSELVRALKLNNGDIFHVWTVNINIEYENGMFYEVEEDGIDQLGNAIWKRTGTVLTASEINGFYKNPIN
jgi:hypothetical protein